MRRKTLKSPKEINEKNKLNVQFYPVKVEYIRFEDNYFDIFYSITVLQYIIN